MIAARPFRRLVALVAAVAIVAAESAAAAYACASPAGAAPMATSAEAPCPEHLAAGKTRGSESPNLCEVHCQGVSAPPLGFPAIAPGPEPAVAIPAPDAASPGRAPPAPEAKGASPPVRSLYCRLQI